jgi:hypothetical protein
MSYALCSNATIETATSVQALEYDEAICRNRSALIGEGVGIQSSMLSYSVLHSSRCSPPDMPLLIGAYRVWADVWRETFYKLDGAQSVPSDDFTRQDEIGALFHGAECIGLTAHRCIDVAHPLYKDDSYFAVWPSDALESAVTFGTRLFICSNLTVAPGWRGHRGQVAELLCALAIERFLKTDADTLVGTPRRDRGVNWLCYRLGVRSLARGVIHHGVPIDLIAFFRKTCTRPPLPPRSEAIVKALQS